MATKTCGILYPNHEFKDNDGCLKSDAHNNHHIFKNQNGDLIAWEDDYSCTCGCWDEWEFNSGQVCINYKKVNSINDTFKTQTVSTKN